MDVFARPRHDDAVRCARVSDARPVNGRPPVRDEHVNPRRRQADVDDQLNHLLIGTSVSSTRHAA